MTLEELKQKRREIDAEIKRLQNSDYCEYGDTKIDKHHYPTTRPDEYILCIRCRYTDGDTRWVSVARKLSRQELIDNIPEIIIDLKGLYDALTVNSERKDER